jgi:hypothetical protein
MTVRAFLKINLQCVEHHVRSRKISVGVGSAMRYGSSFTKIMRLRLCDTVIYKPQKFSIFYIELSSVLIAGKGKGDLKCAKFLKNTFSGTSHRLNFT